MPTKPTPCRHCGGSGVEPDDVAMGRAMRLLRQGENLSLRTVAHRMGFSPPYVSDLELGRRPWNAEKQAKFREALK